MPHRFQLLDWTVEDVQVVGVRADDLEVNGGGSRLFVELH